MTSNIFCCFGHMLRKQQPVLDRDIQESNWIVPNEITDAIFSSLSGKDLARCQGVCRLWKVIISLKVEWIQLIDRTKISSLFIAEIAREYTKKNGYGANAREEVKRLLFSRVISLFDPLTKTSNDELKRRLELTKSHLMKAPLANRLKDVQFTRKEKLLEYFTTNVSAIERVNRNVRSNAQMRYCAFLACTYSISFGKEVFMVYVSPNRRQIFPT